MCKFSPFHYFLLTTRRVFLWQSNRFFSSGGFERFTEKFQIWREAFPFEVLGSFETEGWIWHFLVLFVNRPQSGELPLHFLLLQNPLHSRSFLCIFIEERLHEVSQPPGIPLRQFPWWFFKYIFDDFSKGVALKRFLSGANLIEQASQGPHIATGTASPASQRFRRKVIRRSHCRPRRILLLTHPSGESKIAQLELPVGSDQNIDHFDIPMYDAELAVEVVQSEGQLQQPPPNQPLGNVLLGVVSTDESCQIA